MFVPIIQGGEIENEIEIRWCCVSCSKSMGWSEKQARYFKGLYDKKAVIDVPLGVNTRDKFVKHISSLLISDSV